MKSGNSMVATALSDNRLRAFVAIFLAAVMALFVFAGAPRADGTFNPTISLERSTTRATAHPDARLTVTNPSSEDVKDITVDLPTGFWGSLAAASKCSAANAVAGTCPANSKIGTVLAEGTADDTDVHVDAVLSGDVYLTEPVDPTGPTGPTSPSQTDPAGLSIKVNAKIGNVDMGNVIVNGRVSAIYGPTTLAGATGAIQGMRATIKDLPRSITDAAHGNRTVNFHLKKTAVDLISDLDGPNPPLLTNPSKCGTTQVKASITGYDGGSEPDATDNFVTDQCDTVRFNPTTTYTIPTNTVSSTSKFTATITFPSTPGQPESNGTLDALEVKLPQFIGVNFDTLSPGAPYCSGATVNADGTQFNACNSNAARIGTVTLTTPLLPTPLEGRVLLINTTPVPSIGLDFSPAVAGTNPKGITIRQAGINSTPCLDPTADTGTCQTVLTSKFSSLPDAPVSKVELKLNLASRTGTTASPDLLYITDNGSQNCVPADELTTTISGTSGAKKYDVQTFTSDGCQVPDTTIDSGPFGQILNTNSAAFSFTDTTGLTNVECRVDSTVIVPQSTPCAPSPTTFNATDLANGQHRVFVKNHGFGSVATRAFAVDTSSPPSDNTVPTTTLATGPGVPGPGTEDTADSQPTFTYSSSETGTFQCSLDDGAFLPCGSATGTGTASHTLSAAEALPASDTVHTFRVRAQDTAGNVDLTPASASFKVVKPFAPVATVNLTTTTSRAHPNLTLDVTSDSHEDIKDLQMSLPDGFFGGLTGAQSLCPTLDADAGNCAAGSKIGTVEATALIDRTTATIVGGVYLTESRDPGVEPAGLAIIVKTKLQGVEFEPIVVVARLKTRGETAQGIDTASFDIPNTVKSTYNEVSEFDMKSLSLELTGNNGAPQPLLTNPSWCGTGTFATTFKGRDDSTASSNPTATFVGCENLAFGPSVSIALKDHKTGLPPKAYTPKDPVSADLFVDLAADPNGSGIKDTVIVMPSGLNVNPAKLPAVCQLAQYPDSCPAGSLIGKAAAKTPLLNEDLTGDVYMLKGASTPDLFIRLRGRINANLVAHNRFTGPETNQLTSTLTMLPDAPLSSFHMEIYEFLTTRSNACEYPRSAWNATGSFAGWNGKAASTVSPLEFNCSNADSATVQTLSYKPKKAKTTLSALIHPQSGRSLKTLTVQMPKGLKYIKGGFSKKQIGKKLTVANSEGVKLKTKCFKLSGTTLKITCNVKSKRLTITFKSGSLTTKSKSKKFPKLKVKVVDSTGAKQTAKPVS